MYSGPGSGPMLAAAAAWNTMAAEMRSAAADYDSAVTQLTSTGWLGPSSTSMLAAAEPYVAWLNTTATQAEQTGAQANAAATAFESAFAMTVPPAMVAANRAQLAMLVATNVFGQNTPAIAATEALYAEMWAQDAAAMNGYATASSTTTQFTPFGTPQSPTNEDGIAKQNNMVAQAAKTPAGTAQSTVSSATSNTTTTTTASNAASSAAAPTPGSLTDYLPGLLDGSNNTALGSFLQSNLLSNNVFNGSLAGGPFNPQTILATAVGAMGTRAMTLSGLDDFIAGAEDAASAGSLASNTVGSAGLTGASAGVGNA